MERYFADIFDADGKPYVFDSVADGAECCGPFDSFGNALQAQNDLNTDNDHSEGVRPHMVQSALTGETKFKLRG